MRRDVWDRRRGDGAIVAASNFGRVGATPHQVIPGIPGDGMSHVAKAAVAGGDLRFQHARDPVAEVYRASTNTSTVSTAPLSTVRSSLLSVPPTFSWLIARTS